MERREFITLFGGTAATWPLVARAQQSGGMKRVAILNGNPEIPAARARVAALQQGLGNAGWREGSNISYEVRWGAADPARIESICGGTGEAEPGRDSRY